MCGIVCVKRADGKAAQKSTLKRYSKQKARGEDGFGFVAVDDKGTLTKFKRFMGEKETRESLKTVAESFLLFHHRYPTSTPNLPEAAHPIKVSNKELKFDYFVVHNGVISNDWELKRNHKELGYAYTTEIQTEFRTASGRVFYGDTAFNDSEALAIELARNIEGLQDMANAKGQIAYMVLQVEKASKKAVNLYFGTNGGNPLTMTTSPNGIIIASQGGTPIVANTCHVLDMQTNEIGKANWVTLIPFYEPERRVGYNTSTSYYGGNSYQDDKDYAESYRAKQDAEDEGVGKSLRHINEYINMGLDEIEDELQEVEQAIADTEADIAEELMADNAVGVQELECDLETLKDQRNRLASLYESRGIPF